MKLPVISGREPPLPRCAMHEYLEFVEQMVAFSHYDPERVRNQKELEERIEKRFYFPDVTSENVNHG